MEPNNKNDEIQRVVEEEEDKPSSPEQQQPPPKQENNNNSGGGGGWGWGGFSAFSVLSDLQKAAEDISRNVIKYLFQILKCITTSI